MTPNSFESTFARLCRNLFDAEPETIPPRQTASFGRFRLLAELGRGGVGVVWKALDPLLDREVALKILPPTTSPEDHDRILREARVPSRISHPGIVQVHEVGEVEGRPFIVMDLVSGSPLSRLGLVPLQRRVEVVAELAEILHFAHKHGVVHRDLKPSNVLLTTEGRPVLVDFGLARTIGRDDRVTGTGVVFGTPVYMSPEQASGSPADVDARSDIFSLGVILYELLAGKPPFQAESPYDLLEKILRMEPPRLRHVPPGLEAVAFKAMAKRKEERFDSADAFARDLRAWLAGRSVQALPVRRRRRRGWLIPALAGGATLLLLVAIGLAIRSRESFLAVVSYPQLPLPPVDSRAGWKRATRAALDGDAPLRDLEIRRHREAAERAIGQNPKDLTAHVTLSRLEMLEGHTKEALEILEGAIRQGVPEREMREVQCGIILATSKHLRIADRPFQIECVTLLDDPRFPPVRRRLQDFPMSPFGRALEALLAGRFAEAVAVVPALRDKPHLPELRLLLAIAQYNNRRIPEVLPNLGGLLDEIPGPIVAAISALAHLPTGAANEALSILDRASRLPESDRDILHHLRGLALLELGRHSEAEKSFSRVSNEKVRRYSLGLLEMDRGNGAKAAEHFRACGKYYPAQYHLACVTASDGPGAIALIDTTIKAAWSAGEFNRTGRNEPLQPRTRVAFRGIPYFILGRETLLHDKLLQPLRDDPETGARLRGLAGQ